MISVIPHATALEAKYSFFQINAVPVAEAADKHVNRCEQSWTNKINNGYGILSD